MGLLPHPEGAIERCSLNLAGVCWHREGGSVISAKTDVGRSWWMMGYGHGVAQGKERNT